MTIKLSDDEELQALEWRLKKLAEIKNKLKNGEKLNNGEKMALLFWRDHKWLLKGG